MRSSRGGHDGQRPGPGGERRRRRGGEAAMATAGGASPGRVPETGPSPPSTPHLPVFLFPSELLFSSRQRSLHRRVLTLYNPYAFSISYKMLCTAPSLYRVVEAEGNVRAKSCIDLVVRHLDVSPRHWGRRDRFRLEVRGGGGRVGEREIWAELREGEEEEQGGAGGGGGEEEEERRKSRRSKGGEEEEERRKSRRSKGGGGGQLTPLTPLLVPTRTRLQLPTCSAVRGVSRWVVCVLVAALCVAVLMLPLHGDSSSMVPRCLHVSTNQKLACAYTLGLLTIVFLR